MCVCLPSHPRNFNNWPANWLFYNLQNNKIPKIGTTIKISIQIKTFDLKYELIKI